MLRYRFLLQGRRGMKNEVDIADLNYTQRRSLVNVKLRMVKDVVLDNAVIAQRQLRSLCILISVIASDPARCVPISHLWKHVEDLILPADLDLPTLLRRHPYIFEEVMFRDKVGRPVPWFKLTAKAEKIRQEEEIVFQNCYVDVLQRLQKLLMLTRHRILPLLAIDRLKWDLGLPHDYTKSLIPCHRDLFSLVRIPQGHIYLKLLKWDESLAVSHLEMSSGKENGNSLAFPVKFARGFGLKRKCMKWLEEWQTLPYTSPYVDASHLDRRTDVSEKRNVGVFHELLHLTIQKKTERGNVASLRKPLALPQKFTTVFRRHPGIFYISRKGDRHTVLLREAYDRARLIEKHPLAEIREKYKILVREGERDVREEKRDRRRGLLYNSANEEHREDASGSSRAKKMEMYESEEDSDEPEEGSDESEEDSELDKLLYYDSE